MKLLGLIAAGLLGAVTLAPASASAAPAASAVTLAVAGVAGAGQAVVVRNRTVVRNRGWRGGNRWGSRRVCENRRRGGHRVRVCRNVRYRR